jgi:hypothetical protein
MCICLLHHSDVPQKCIAHWLPQNRLCLLFTTQNHKSCNHRSHLSQALRPRTRQSLAQSYATQSVPQMKLGAMFDCGTATDRCGRASKQLYVFCSLLRQMARYLYV